MLKKQLAKIGDAVTCPTAIVLKDGRALIGLRHYSEKSVWTCPGGRCDTGEMVETTLRREVQEETGITDLGILEFVDEIDGAHQGDRVPVFLCSTKDEATLMEPHKFSEWRWVDDSDFPENFINASVRSVVIEMLAESRR